MKDTRSIPIDEIVGLLHLYDGEKIDKLKLAYPKYIKHLKLGILAGESKEDELLFRSKVCEEGLKSVVKICETRIPIVKKRLKNNSNLSLVAQILATLGSALTVLFAEQEADKIFIITAATFTLISSILSVIIQNKNKVTGLATKGLPEILEELIRLKISADFHVQELMISQKYSNEEPGTIKNLIREGNKLCMEIKIILSHIL